jgi:hypothetical protein
MARKKNKKKERKRQSRPALTEEEQTQLQLLMDRLAAQDPEGESLTQFSKSLKPLVERSVPFTLAFIEALGAKATPVAVQVLHGLQEIPAEKPVRRALKTALYRLARQGLVVEEEQADSAPRVLVPRPADRQAEGWASWPESRGERGIVLKLPDAGRGYLMAVGVLNSEGVFKDYEAIQTTRKGVKALFDQITGGVEERLITIPLDHLLFLYEEVAGIYKKQNREFPTGYEVMHKQLLSWANEVSHPHIYDLVDSEEIANDPLLLRGSGSLLEAPPFVSWQLDEEIVNPFVEKIKDLSESRIVISQSAQMERTEQIVREAAVELFTPELRLRYRRLLEEAALLLYLVDRQQEAKWALAAAIDLESEVGLLSENAFVLGLIKNSIASKVDLEQQDAETRETGEKRTESGLIIPR